MQIIFIRITEDYPSTLGTNWKWRMKKEAMTEELAARMHMYVKTYGRL